METNEKKLLIMSHSGGMDSTVTMLQALNEGFYVLPINFLYGQKNFIEVIAQQNIFNYLKERFPTHLLDTIKINLNSIIKNTIDKYQIIRDDNTILEKTDEKFYTPNRNLMFMVLCATIGEIEALANNFNEIYIGLGIHKHSAQNYKKDYWDITPEFINRLKSLLELNDSIKINIYSPFVNNYKSKIIETGLNLNFPLSLTWSCYDPIIENGDSNESTYRPCLKCEACLERESQANHIGFYDINKYEIKVNFHNKDVQI